METALPLLLFLTALFVLVIFALAMGMLSREQERKEAEESAAKAALERVAGPRFFAKLEPSTRHESRSVDRVSAVAALEHYLRAEHMGARRFVTEPSASGLFRNGDRGTGVVVGQLERYLQEEQRMARCFGLVAETPWIEAVARVPDASLQPGEGERAMGRRS